jgi:hypothetical protein
VTSRARYDSGTGQELHQRGSERRQIAFDHAPHDPIVDRCIGVDQDIAKRNDLSVILDALRQNRIMPCPLRERLSHDFELALYRRTKQLVAPVVLQILAFAEPHDTICCLLDIEKILPQLKLHRAEFFLVPRALGNSNSEDHGGLSGPLGKQTAGLGVHAGRNRSARIPSESAHRDPPGNRGHALGRHAWPTEQLEPAHAKLSANLGDFTASHRDVVTQLGVHALFHLTSLPPCRVLVERNCILRGLARCASFV